MPRNVQTMCPHCACPLSGVQTSRDHIVSAFLGGTWTVPSCKTCNDVLGASIEARLARPNSWLTVLSQAEGLTEGWVHGRNEREQRTRHHFGSRSHEWVTPWHEKVSEGTDRTRLRVAAPPHTQSGYIQHLAKLYGGQAIEIDRFTAPVEQQTIDTTVSIFDLRRLSAKTALCAGAFSWGDEFLTSPGAQWLRTVLDVGSEWPAGRSDPPPTNGELHAGGRWPVEPADADFILSQMKSTLEYVLSRTVAGDNTFPPTLPVVGLTPVDAGTAFLAWSSALRVAFPVLLVPYPLPEPRRPILIIQPPRNAGHQLSS